MKKFLLLFVLCFAGSGLMAQSQLPALQIQTIKGDRISTSSLLDGKTPIVLSFWSTICKPCIDELNVFRDQWTKWQKEVSFNLVAVSTDDLRSEARVRTFVASRQWPFTILLDKNQDFKRALNVNAIPQLYVIDRSGKIVYTHIGYTPGSEQKVLEVLKGL